jgi:hypothetical protein
MDEHGDQFPEALRRRLHDLSLSLPPGHRIGERELLAQGRRQIGRARVRRFAWRMAAAGGLAACVMLGVVIYRADQTSRPEASPVATVSQGDLTRATMADALRAARSLQQSGRARATQADVDHIAMASVSLHQEGRR